MTNTTLIKKIWGATFLRRWHKNAHLAHTPDTLAGHQGRVAILLLQYWPDSSAHAIKYALTHDIPEAFAAGDMCGEFKRNNPDIYEMLDKAEQRQADKLALAWSVTISEKQRVTFCDRLDAYLWAQHHAPHILNTTDWIEAHKDLTRKADDLGVDLPEEIA